MAATALHSLSSHSQYLTHWQRGQSDGLRLGFCAPHTHHHLYTNRVASYRWAPQLPPPTTFLALLVFSSNRLFWLWSTCFEKWNFFQAGISFKEWISIDWFKVKGVGYFWWTVITDKNFFLMKNLSRSFYALALELWISKHICLVT